MYFPFYLFIKSMQFLFYPLIPLTYSHPHHRSLLLFLLIWMDRLYYLLFPLPETVLGNALGNGMSGFLSGFMGGFIGLLAYLLEVKKQKIKTRKPFKNE